MSLMSLIYIKGESELITDSSLLRWISVFSGAEGHQLTGLGYIDTDRPPEAWKQT